MSDQLSWRKLPTKPGVYIFRDQNDRVIYVGKAKDLRKRVYSYFSNKALEGKTIQLVQAAKKLDHIIVTSEIEAFFLEASLIKKYKPYYNVKLTDDKSYPLLKIGQNDGIPYVAIARNTDDKKAKYFGPYAGITDLKIVLRILRRIFPYHSVKNHSPKRCLYNHLGLCPCIPAYPEKLPEYKKNMRALGAFLNGGKEKVVKMLEHDMKEYSKREEFEKAAEVQKKIERINFITEEHYSPFQYEEKPDFYFQRIKSEMESLREILTKYDLDVGELHRIECYDISNISGKNATGSMVVFHDGDIFKNDYRRFKIRFKKTPDDFEMHREVARRRAKRSDWEKPNLMVIDGGKGQVSAVLQAHAEQNYKVPVIGLAKKEETIVIPVKTGHGLDFLEIKLPTSTPGVNLLRRIRDEAHRFAITYHKLLRRKALAI